MTKAKFIKQHITEEILNNEPLSYFVFGDSYERSSEQGAGKLRKHRRSISFITRVSLKEEESAFFKPQEYAAYFFPQLDFLEEKIKTMPDYKFYISKLGAGGANKFNIWKSVIGLNLIKTLGKYENVVFCWSEEEQVFEDPNKDPEKYQKLEIVMN